MSEKDRLVAIISPWEKLAGVVKQKFRLESLPEEKKVMVWRDDLRTEQELTGELRKIGIVSMELRKKAPTEWNDID
jgi:hypothetical protein